MENKRGRNDVTEFRTRYPALFWISVQDCFSAYRCFLLLGLNSCSICTSLTWRRSLAYGCFSRMLRNMKNGRTAVAGEAVEHQALERATMRRVIFWAPRAVVVVLH